MHGRRRRAGLTRTAAAAAAAAEAAAAPAGAERSRQRRHGVWVVTHTPHHLLYQPNRQGVCVCVSVCQTSTGKGAADRPGGAAGFIYTFIFFIFFIFTPKGDQPDA